MQGGRRPERHEHHQPDDGGEQQLARVLPLSMLVEHLVDPAGRQCVFQGRACHQARRCILLERSMTADQSGSDPCNASDIAKI